jgi:hypothetical protein
VKNKTAMLCLVSRLFRVTDSLFSPNFDIHISLHHHRPPTTDEEESDGGRWTQRTQSKSENKEPTKKLAEGQEEGQQQPTAITFLLFLHTNCTNLWLLLLFLESK